jgi:hypothetical protein
LKDERVMSAGGILLTFIIVFVVVSLIVALLFHFWPGFGSVAAAVEYTDGVLEKMEGTASAHEA